MKYYCIAFITRKNGKKEGLSFSIYERSRQKAKDKLMDDILSQCNEDDELSINILTKKEYEDFIINRVI